MQYDITLVLKIQAQIMGIQSLINQCTCKTNNKHAYRYKALYYYIDVYKCI